MCGSSLTVSEPLQWYRQSDQVEVGILLTAARRPTKQESQAVMDAIEHDELLRLRALLAGGLDMQPLLRARGMAVTVVNLAMRVDYQRPYDFDEAAANNVAERQTSSLKC